MKEKFSVLMSVYIKEKPEYFRECMESLLAQTVPASEWVIVEDGPLTESLYKLLSEYGDAYPGLIKRVPLPKNQGLGSALAEGIKHCSYNLVARMDADDIALPNRFEKQLQVFVEDPALDICGGQIDEFEGEICNVVSTRNVPLSDAEIKQFQKRRDAFNHVSVMFKKDTVLKSGNYQPTLLMEDTVLWCNMILAGAKCKNLSDTLVLVRTGADMYARRGGWSYFLKYRQGRKKVLETGYISCWDYLLTLTVQFFVALAPKGVRRFVFTKLLRKSGGAH